MARFRGTFINPTSPSVGGYSEWDELDGNIISPIGDFQSDGEFIGYTSFSGPREKWLKTGDMKYAGDPATQHEHLRCDVEEIKSNGVDLETDGAFAMEEYGIRCRVRCKENNDEHGSNHTVRVIVFDRRWGMTVGYISRMTELDKHNLPVFRAEAKGIAAPEPFVNTSLALIWIAEKAGIQLQGA